MATWSNSSATTYTSNDVWYTWSSDSATTSGNTWSTGTASSITDTGYIASWEIRNEDIYSPPIANSHCQNMQNIINAEWRQMQADWLREEKEAAENTAKALLLDLVSEKEFEMYEKTGKLLVKGRKHDYIVHKRGNIAILFRGSHYRHERAAKDLCVHLNNADKNKCPDTDNVIAMKLHIEHEEKKFLETANHYHNRSLNKDEADFLKVVNE